MEQNGLLHAQVTLLHKNGRRHTLEGEMIGNQSQSDCTYGETIYRLWQELSANCHTNRYCNYYYIITIIIIMIITVIIIDFTEPLFDG
jgi:hypothetical protein